MKPAADIVPQIRAASASHVDPGGFKYTVISLADISRLSRQNDTPRLQIEISALEKGIVPVRYLRNLGTIGIKGQIKLLRSCVAVAGAGGLGGIVIELLARAGVGHLIIVDCDRFSENNLNRQLLAGEKSIGKSKARAAASRIREINSSLLVTAHSSRMNKSNAGQLLKGADMVIDALDNLPSRFVLAEACRKLKVPLIHGAIAGFHGQVMTILPHDKSIASVYGSPQPGRDHGIELFTGNPPTTPAIIGALEVQEAIKLITGTGKPLRHGLLMLDLADNTAETIPL